MTNVLEIRGLKMSFGGLAALQGLDLDVREGQITSVIGPNGAGKTTFFNVVSGLYAPDQGEILFDGQPIQGLASHAIAKIGIARTFQTVHLFPNMTVLENAMVGQHARSKTGVFGAIFRPPSVREEEERIREKAAEALAFFGSRLQGSAGAARVRVVVREPQAVGDRARHGDRAALAAPGRADGGHEPARNAGAT